jgi:P-type E1-E2 ATPase
VYTPAVFALAGTVALVGPLVTGTWSGWFYSALVLLVIGCPCALVISTPVSVVASLAAAARNGVLIKGGAFVEAPATIKAIALDKTGTLTEGRPTVASVLPHSGHTDQELLAIAAGLETHSDHPLARAILTRAEREGITPARVVDFAVVPGKGATGVIDGMPYWLGSHRYLEERGQETPAVHEELEAQRARRPGRAHRCPCNREAAPNAWCSSMGRRERRRREDLPGRERARVARPAGRGGGVSGAVLACGAGVASKCDQRNRSGPVDAAVDRPSAV